MFEFNESAERQHCLEESIKHLEIVNKRIAKLLVMKEELTQQIIGALGHEHEGQRSYEYGMWKVEVKTPVVYSLNKKLYETGQYSLPAEFNPIKESVSYSIDKRLCDHYLETAPFEVRESLIDLIEKKPGKMAVSIKEKTV